MLKTSISAIEPSDFTSVIAIADACFGKNYLSNNQLNKMLENYSLSCKIRVNNIIIGFCLAQIINPNKKDMEFAVPDSQTVKIAIIKTLAVHPDFQRQGFGTQLLKHLLEKIDKLGDVSSIYYPSWIEPKSEGFCKSVKNEGFTEFQLYKNFWLNDSLQNNYSCIICGNPPCNCSMRLYRKS